MLKITIIAKSTKDDPKLVNVRFRLLDGRKADISHRSSIKATLADLAKFTAEGELRPRISLYNRKLFNDITSEIALMRKAYEEMQEKGLDMTSRVMDGLIEGIRNPAVVQRQEVQTIVARLTDFYKGELRDGLIGEKRSIHIAVVRDKLERFLHINGVSHLTAKEFDDEMLLMFRQFLYDEYLYVPKFPSLYKAMSSRNIPQKRLSTNTVVGQLKVLQSFFNDLETRGEIDRSPFSQMSKERKKAVMRSMYDEPVFLRREEFETVRTAKVPASLKDVRDVFVVHCALGCRVSDFKRMTMDNVSVSPEGIPFVHYLPQKTVKEQETNTEVQTPLVRFAFDIIKRNQFSFRILRYVSGKSGYNAKIKELLAVCGINRTVPVYDEEKGTNVYKPVWEVASTKLARKTHVDMLSKVQINLYVAGLHKAGSGAVHRYTSLEMKDRFALYNLAFGEEAYMVDNELNIL